jgi:uncharacterized protein (TIGR00369 family)
MREPGAAALREMIEDLVGASPFARRLGLHLVSLEQERAEVELPFDEGNVTIGDMVHGGALAALIDVAAVAASWSGVDVDSPPSGGATLSTAVNYLNPARGEALRAAARVTRRGRGVCFSDVSVTGENGNPVAQAIVAYRFSSG